MHSKVKKRKNLRRIKASRKRRIEVISKIPIIKFMSELDNKLYLKIFKENPKVAIKQFMKIVTRLGDGYFWLLFAISFFVLKIPYAPIYFIRVLVCVFFSVTTFIYIKNFVDRERPCKKHNKVPFMRPPDRASFPSGHTMAAFSIAFSLGTYSVPFGIVAYTLAFLIAFSRIFVGLHYPFDVIVGMVLGTSISLFNNVLFYLLIGLPIVGKYHI